MDFASLPPEINSARMYVGPGSGPMLAAAAAWEVLGTELHATASSYQSAIAGLTAGPWLGPVSMLMATAAAPYVVWLRTTATQAEQTVNQSVAAAAAYDAAFAATVPPPLVAANRAQFMALVATNFFGQNTPAIATTEAQYAEMWAQDAAAMLGYASASASATSLTPFTAPSPITDSGAQAGQAAAVVQAAGVSAGDVQSAVSNAAQAFAAVPNALTGLAAPAAALPPLSLLDLLDIVDAVIGMGGVGVDSPLAAGALPYDIGGYDVGLHTDDIVAGWAGLEAWPGMAPVPPTSFPVVTNSGASISAGLGEATSVGALSVPAGWTAAAPEMRLLATALPAANIGIAAEASAGSAGSLFGQMALAGMAGRAMAGTVGGGGGAGRRERERIGGPTRKPTESSQQDLAEPSPRPPGGPITSIAAELRELAALRDSGILTADEFTDQKQRLLAY